ncbi:unnamed protein product [Wuchereria bancrofti]|uniref:Uncharacterized protein n=1 Tax=Wuchereria bancrofti TaxID=6293 RepID=A0A3P7EJZ1_WUCBA|nr:unnamed protein product [Wuchereria bancrofti]
MNRTSSTQIRPIVVEVKAMIVVSRSYPVYCHMSYLRLDYLLLLSFLQIISTIWLLPIMVSK